MSKIHALQTEIIELKLKISEKERQIEELTNKKTEKVKTPEPWPSPTIGLNPEDS